MERTLRDGTRLVIRPIRPSDKAGLSAGLASLSELSRHRRFLSPKVRFTAAELRYLIQYEWAQTEDDVLWRRSKLGLRIGDGDTARLAAYMADRGQGGLG